MTDRLLTARELAETLGVATGSLLRWTRRGEVPAVKLPSGAVRYRPEEIEDWLASRAMGTASEELSRTPSAVPAAEGKGATLAGSRTHAGHAATTEEELHAR